MYITEETPQKGASLSNILLSLSNAKDELIEMKKQDKELVKQFMDLRSQIRNLQSDNHRPHTLHFHPNENDSYFFSMQDCMTATLPGDLHLNKRNDFYLDYFQSSISHTTRTHSMYYQAESPEFL